MANITHGMSVDEVRNLARMLDQRGADVETMAREITAALDSAPWVGPDAEAYKEKWRNEGVRQMTEAKDILVAAGQAANQNAQAQDDTSQAATGQF
jgi:hypothetical protein